MMGDAIALCLSGAISPEVALARLVLEGHDIDATSARLAAEGSRAAPLQRMLDNHRENLTRLAEIVSEHGISHDWHEDSRSAAVARIAASFDRAVQHLPEASVAAYSLGDPAILARATGELIEWLAVRGLAAPEMDVLDLGCGIGRVAIALAPMVRSVLGLDVSFAMIEAARSRANGVTKVRFEQTSGTELASLPDRAFDLILAVDSFPYLVQAGVAEAHLYDVPRLLRPGGAFAIFNLSYGGLEADRMQAASWAKAYDLALACNGEQPFRLWDGAAFLFGSLERDGLRRTRVPNSRANWGPDRRKA
ncbi:MAG: class I SAM-dependent methyltransferase [Acetobacteraceae bacterium]|nr:class I SAM-dependent methyltransferase [Acetobacteraceae bacterium]MBV8589148.1 class I SAM-dependent methyltransferase [Acetobacteraceae bacterium]